MTFYPALHRSAELGKSTGVAAVRRLRPVGHFLMRAMIASRIRQVEREIALHGLLRDGMLSKSDLEWSRSIRDEGLEPTGMLKRSSPSFEAVFLVPLSHTLTLVRSRSRGSTSSVQWEHEELDADGRLVARFESFGEADADGYGVTGWRKYDSGGALIEHCNHPLL